MIVSVSNVCPHISMWAALYIDSEKYALSCKSDFFLKKLHKSIYNTLSFSCTVAECAQKDFNEGIHPAIQHGFPKTICQTSVIIPITGG